MQTSSSVPANRPLSLIESSQLRCGGERVGTASFPSSSMRPLRSFDEALSRGVTQSTKGQLDQPKKDVNKKTIDEATPSTLYVDFHPIGRPRLQQQHQQRRLSVRFAPHLHEERDHIARADMSESEVLTCWYDEIDLEELQMDAVATVRALRQLRAEPKPNPSSLVAQLHQAQCGVYCRGRELERRGLLSSRGLEHLVDPELLERCRAVRDGVVRAVLIEQEAVRILTEERGFHVIPGADESIARASAYVSLASAEIAVLVALEDASAAKEIASERNRNKIKQNNRKRLVDALLRSTF